jgi:hypothetical protein
MLWRHWALSVFGAWFGVSSWVLGMTTHPLYLWPSLVLGALMLLGGIWGLVDRVERAWRSWVLALLGLILAMFPWMTGAAATPTWASLLVGAAALAAGIWNAFAGGTTASPGRPSHRRAS